MSAETGRHVRLRVGGPAGRRRALSHLAVTVGLLACLLAGPASGATPAETLFGDSRPAATVASDASAVTLGTDVTARRAGNVVGARVFQGPGVARSTLTAGLYSSEGALLARKSFESSGSAGWQRVTFDAPVVLREGVHVTAAVLLPQGRYVAAYDFPFPVRSSSLVATRGVYRYGSTLATPPLDLPAEQLLRRPRLRAHDREHEPSTDPHPDGVRDHEPAERRRRPDIGA